MCFDNFKTNYVNAFSRYPNLVLSKEELYTYYLDIFTLGQDLEDYTEYIPKLFDVFFLVKLNRLVRTLIALGDDSIATFMRLLVNDLVILSSLIPCIIEIADTKPYSLYDYESIVKRQCITPITPQLVNQILEELVIMLEYNNEFDPSKSCLIDHIYPESYMQVRNSNSSNRMGQTMMTLYLCNFTSTFKAKVLDNPLYIKIYESPVNHLYMLACSTADEQYFLNTCDIATTLNALILHHPNILTLIILGMEISAYIRRKTQDLSEEARAYPTLLGSMLVPSVKKYVLEELDHFDSEMLIVKLSLFLVTSFESNIDKALDHILRSWHNNLQRLSSIFVPESPIILSKKIFSEKWHISSNVMTVYSFLAQFIPGAPTFLSRARASKDLTQVPCFNFHTAKFHEIEDPSFPNLREKLYNARTRREEQLQIMNAFWLQVLDSRCILFDTPEVLFGFWHISHFSLCTVYLAKKNGVIEKRFLISDPEIRHFKSMTMEQMVDLCCKK